MNHDRSQEQTRPMPANYRRLAEIARGRAAKGFYRSAILLYREAIRITGDSDTKFVTEVAEQIHAAKGRLLWNSN